MRYAVDHNIVLLCLPSHTNCSQDKFRLITCWGLGRSGLDCYRFVCLSRSPLLRLTSLRPKVAFFRPKVSCDTFCGTVPGSEPPDTSSLLAIASMAESHIFSVEDVGPSLLVLLPCEAPTRRASDTFNTASAHSPSPEVAGSNDGRVVDDAADKRPRPLVFDVFAEDDNRLVHDGQ
jgi:hypothetical protein